MVGTRKANCRAVNALRMAAQSSRPPSSRALLVGSRKVYSVREADVVMTSAIFVIKLLAAPA